LSGPAGLPADVTLKLNQAVARMLADPEVQKRMTRDAIETRRMTPAEFTQFVAGEIDKWVPVAKRVMPTK
jgi:tripartite-type tricarboxylate transporter receptor subunit TctC